MASESAASHLDMLPPAGWACHELGDLVDQDRGISYGIVQPGKNDISGVPIVRVNNIRAGRIETSDVLRVSPTTEQKYQRTRLRGGEVLLSLVGTLGECAVVPQELAGWNVARAVAVIPLKDGINSRWVVTCLRSRQLQHLIRTWATTTVQATLNLRDVRRLPVLMPPDGEVEALMNLVNPFDDKIELNRQINRTLEAMARAIFKAWFVDFEPVKAKAAGATSFRGMPQEVFDQLPARLSESELGPVPERWEVLSIASVANVSRESVKPGDFPEEVFEHFSIPAFDSGMVPANDLGDSIKSNKYKVPSNCVLVSKLNPRFARVWLPDEPKNGRRQICSTEFLVVSPKEGWTRDQLFCQFIGAGFRQDLQQRASGTSNSHQRIKPKDFERTPIIAPPRTVRDVFAGIVGPLFDKSANGHRESQILASIRDTLLPKLICGEIRVPEALEDADGG